MPEDKLTRAERVRLEALAQVITYSAYTINTTDIETILERAEKIETWLYKAKEPR